MAQVNVANTKIVFADTKLKPYYNDFDESKNYYQILSRPEYAVQARELTQISTILQNQIERFGRHIFVDGSPVIGGQISTSSIVSLNLESTYANTDIIANNYINKTIQYTANTDVQARVLTATDSNANEPPTLYIRYLTGSEFGSADAIMTSDSEAYANVIASANTTANGMIAFIPDSIYFVDGYFVKTPKQIVVVDKYDNTNTNARIGLEKVKSIVTENDDTSLLDPAAEASNFDAPGATRFKFELVLAKRALDSEDDESFVELLRIENGKIKKQVDKPIYSEIEEVLARRTYDESGNYTVKPFKAAMTTSLSDNANNVLLSLSSGKAYIFGYEYETNYATDIEIPRSRTTQEVSNYNLNLNYGNYVIVDDIQGLFDVSTAQLFDIHSVPYEYVDRTSSATYATTKIGSARVRDIEFYSGDTDVTARKFEFYLFDARFNAITGTASSTSNATTEIVINSSGSSANSNAYTGATITITGGTGEGDVRTISNYVGSTKIATVDTAFSTTLDNTSTYSITFDFAEAESFVIDPSYTIGASIDANTNITTLNKNNGQSNGSSFVTEPARLPLVFKFPENYITPATLADYAFNYRKKYSSVQFTDGGSTAIIAGTDEGFEGTSSSSNTDSRVMDNFLVVCTDNQGSGRANGEQIKVTSTVTIGAPEQATFDTGGGAGDTFSATVLAKMDITGASAGPRVKTLVKANTATFATEAPANTFIGSTGSNTSVYLTTGQVFIENPSKIADERESLYISDAIAAVKIYDLNGAGLPSAGDSLTSFTDVTNKYTFDNGQKASFYDHANIRLKPGYGAPKGPLVVCLRYYSSTTDYGYFALDSYPSLLTEITEEGVSIGTGYSLIPKYDGTPLRDAIDFRPVRKNASNTSPNFTLGGVRFPVSATDFTSDYEYYLGRRDLIVLSANRQIERIAGVPSLYPQWPLKPSRSMVLHALFVPPFTEYPANVSVRYIDNQRYTMKDIGNIDKRLTNVEYYITLSQLEQNALTLKIEDVDGLDRSKYGIFVDSFVGHGLGDTALSDYRVSMDINGRYAGGIATPTTNVTAFKMEVDNSTLASVVEKGNRLLLNYTTEPMITQNVATKYTAVADYLFATYEGQVIARPEADIWKDDVVEQIINETIIEVSTPNVQEDTRVDDWTRQTETFTSGGSMSSDGGSTSWIDTNGDGITDTQISGAATTGVSSAEQGSSTGGKIVCTAMNDAYGFGEFRQAIWLKYSIDKLQPEHEIGYHAIFKPVVAYGFDKNKKSVGRTIVRTVMEHLARHRTADLRAEMYGRKRDKLGRAYRAILEPICYVTGSLINKYSKG